MNNSDQTKTVDSSNKLCEKFSEAIAKMKSLEKICADHEIFSVFFNLLGFFSAKTLIF